MQKVGVSELRENLSVYLKKVQKGQSITITSRGRDMAILTPLEDKRNEVKELLKNLGKTAVIGDILSPIHEEWEAMK